MIMHYNYVWHYAYSYDHYNDNYYVIMPGGWMDDVIIIIISIMHNHNVIIIMIIMHNHNFKRMHLIL